MHKNIAMLYICIGKYKMFLKDYIESCEKNFMPENKKKYFIFCDSSVEDIMKDIDVDYLYKFEKKRPFPMATLKRFHMFNSIESELNNFDYIYFTNANIIFEQRVAEEEVLPNEQDNHLVSVNHPDHYLSMDPNSFPYERNIKSSACIEFNHGKTYFQGCFIGGRAKEFLKMSKELEQNIDYDMSINYMAIWHDESHTNKYYAHTPPKKLSPAYSYPESRNLPGIPRKIVQVDKNKFGTYEYLRS